MTIIYDLPELWDAKSRATIELAGPQVVGTALMPYTGLDAAASFEAVMGEMYVRFTSDLTTHALALWGGIRFQNSEVITLPLVVHEMGHLFSVRAKNKPTKQMWIDRNKIPLAISWPGMHPPSIAKYNIVERFCNAWEVWVMELYAQNANGMTPAGRALRTWFATHMGEWVKIAIGG